MSTKVHVRLQDLEKSFQRHWSVYQAAENSGRSASHRLLLFYAVECGLKMLIMRNIKAKTTRELFNHHEYENLKDGKRGHDIKFMLEKLKPEKAHDLQIPKLLCQSGEEVKPCDWNQVWRYGVQTEQDSERNVEEQLRKIANWIEGRLRRR